MEQFIGIVRGRTVNSTRGPAPAEKPAKTAAKKSAQKGAQKSGQKTGKQAPAGGRRKPSRRR